MLNLCDRCEGPLDERKSATLLSRPNPGQAGEYWVVHGDADLCQSCYGFVMARLVKLFLELAPRAKGPERRDPDSFARIAPAQES